MPESAPNCAAPVTREMMLAVRAAFDPDAARHPETFPAPTLDDVHRFVTERIRALLVGRRELLFSILYRIDVPEEHVKALFSEAPADAIPARLADLVIRRQIQKVELRQRYGSAS